MNLKQKCKEISMALAANLLVLFAMVLVMRHRLRQMMILFCRTWKRTERSEGCTPGIFRITGWV